MYIISLDFNYQQPIVITNGSKFAGKIFPEVPTSLHDYVEVVPHEATSAPGENVLFSVKFRPR